MSVVKSWSLSSLSLYEQCPLKYKLERIDKLPTPTSHALQRGIHIHALAEQYLLGNITGGMPPQLAKFTREMQNLKKGGALAEEMWVLDKMWQHVKSDDAWMSKEAWLRAKGDARIGNFVVDFKTGKKYDKHEDQARLYSNILMQMFPEMEEVEVEFWYLDSGEVGSYTFYRADLAFDISEWEKRVSDLFRETEWKPKHNDYCRWCPFQDKCELFGARKKR